MDIQSAKSNSYRARLVRRNITVTIPKGTRVRLPVAGAAVVDDTAKVIGSNAADLQHYFTWIDLADVDIEPSE
ncbi:MAG: hypothetical protein WAK55_27345 [Xanthobacteraceae bacterium]